MTCDDDKNVAAPRMMTMTHRLAADDDDDERTRTLLVRLMVGDVLWTFLGLLHLMKDDPRDVACKLGLQRLLGTRIPTMIDVRHDVACLQTSLLLQTLYTRRDDTLDATWETRPRLLCQSEGFQRRHDVTFIVARIVERRPPISIISKTKRRRCLLVLDEELRDVAWKLKQRRLLKNDSSLVRRLLHHLRSDSRAYWTRPRLLPFDVTRLLLLRDVTRIRDTRGLWKEGTCHLMFHLGIRLPAKESEFAVCAGRLE